MSDGQGLYDGASGLALGTGLYTSVQGLWSGAAGLESGGNAPPPSAPELNFSIAGDSQYIFMLFNF